MGRVTQMRDDLVCWDGITAVVRPLSWGELEEAEQAATRKVLTRYSGADLEALTALSGSGDSQAEKAVREAGSDLDRGVVLKHGLLLYDGDEPDDALLAEIDGRSADEIVEKIVALSRPADPENLSGEPRTGTEDAVTSLGSS